jgi:hypothetical protein
VREKCDSEREREKCDYKRDVLLTIYNKSCDYYKAPLILRYPRVTHYLKAFLDPIHGDPWVLPTGVTRGFWSSLAWLYGHCDWHCDIGTRRGGHQSHGKESACSLREVSLNRYRSGEFPNLNRTIVSKRY